MRRWIACAAAIAAPFFLGAAQRTPPVGPAIALGTYQQPDGAITVFASGLFVEPYFAMRALLTAAALGVETEAAARRWIAWALPRLEADSSFLKYCRSAASAWTPCGPADADDAALALWIELLHRTAGRAGPPASWRRAIAIADRRLGVLHDSLAGTYVVSRTLPVSLLMDNVEIRASFDAVAEIRGAARDAAARAGLRRRAARLGAAIDRVFWRHDARAYRATTQAVPLNSASLYPDATAEVFPAVFGYGTPTERASDLVARWMRAYGDRWLAGEDRDYPWGLIAVAAMRAGDRSTTACWLAAAAPLRHGPRWNVLEEAIYQSLSPSFSASGAMPPCVRAGSAF